ncbi:tetratricopeptide repeat protein, partial [Nitrospinae bacterium AH-259-F20]|nr:tetratricopeptide repeat protein [Nitrospinae bacterium AH-259-F20]
MITPNQGQTRSKATWIFGTSLLVLLAYAFIFGPPTLPLYKLRILAIASALLASLFAFFLPGDIVLEITSIKSRFGEIGVKATGSIAVFLFVLWWWSSPFAPIGQREKVVSLLENELSLKNRQIEFLQGQIERPQALALSRKARMLAEQIPSDADSYALALKATAERRFDDARRFLNEAERNKKVELAKIYVAHGEMEVYAGRYPVAVGWYQKALDLRPNDPGLLNSTALALHLAANYTKAEPLYRRSLTIREKTLGPEHPGVATSLNNLAGLFLSQGKYFEAEPLFKRSLAIREKVYRPNHPGVAQVLNNLAALYRAQGRYAEAEPLFVRSLGIWETVLGPNHPDVAQGLNNLAALYFNQGKYVEAEPLFKRSLEIREKLLGPDHPDVAQGLNNLAALYKAQGRYSEAEPLYKRFP